MLDKEINGIRLQMLSLVHFGQLQRLETVLHGQIVGQKLFAENLQGFDIILLKIDQNKEISRVVVVIAITTQTFSAATSRSAANSASFSVSTSSV